MKREINKIFTCSTGHITKEDADLLRASDDIPSAHYEFGDFIPVPSDEDLYKDLLARCSSDGYSKEFIRLLEIAKENDCVYLQLDCDGETYEDLPEFSW